MTASVLTDELSFGVIQVIPMPQRLFIYGLSQVGIGSSVYSSHQFSVDKAVSKNDRFLKLIVVKGKTRYKEHISVPITGF